MKLRYIIVTVCVCGGVHACILQRLAKGGKQTCACHVWAIQNEDKRKRKKNKKRGFPVLTEWKTHNSTFTYQQKEKTDDERQHHFEREERSSVSANKEKTKHLF